MKTSGDLIADLIATFGEAKVREVEEIVNMSDSDMAYSTFEDMGDEDACSIIEALYFES